MKCWVTQSWLSHTSIRNEKLEKKNSKITLRISRKYFDEVAFLHLTRKNNQIVDALVTLASVWDNPKGLLMRLVILMKAKVLCFGNTQVSAVKEGKKPWYSDILRLMACEKFLKNANKKDKILLRSIRKRFFIFNRVLYKRDKIFASQMCFRKRSRIDYARCAFRGMWTSHEW